jgi:AraC-like DNA-binding protein
LGPWVAEKRRRRSPRRFSGKFDQEGPDGVNHRVFGGDRPHSSEQLSLRERATERRLSISHFAATFSQSMGASLHRWLMKRRVEIAKQMVILREF